MHKLYGWPCSLRKRRGAATSQLSGANSLIFDNIFIHISIPMYMMGYPITGHNNCMPRQELCSISIIIILAGWLVGHATCIELYCEHNARLSSLSSSSSSYLDTVLLLVAVVHGGGTGGVRRRRPPRMHRLFQSPAKSWRIVKASLLSATTSLGRLLHHYICNLLCKYFATVLVLRCCSGSVPSPPLRSSPVAVQLLHSGR